MTIEKGSEGMMTISLLPFLLMSEEHCHDF